MKPWILLPLSLLILALGGCVEAENGTKTITHHEVYRLNYDGSTTMWEARNGIILKSGYVCWDADNGGEMCVSGMVTVRTIITKVEVVVRNEKEEEVKEIDGKGSS